MAGRWAEKDLSAFFTNYVTACRSRLPAFASEIQNLGNEDREAYVVVCEELHTFGVEIENETSPEDKDNHEDTSLEPRPYLSLVNYCIPVYYVVADAVYTVQSHRFCL